jgi:hypothetical protein
MAGESKDEIGVTARAHNATPRAHTPMLAIVMAEFLG